MEALDVVLFGEAMAMFIADGYGPLEAEAHYTRAVAGAEVNVAVALSRLGYRAGWMSRVGDDPLGSYILAALRREGIDTERVLRDPSFPTGFQLKSRVLAGNPEVVYYRRGSAASRMAPSAADDAYIRTARHLHVTGIPPALSASCRRFTYHAIEQARDVGMTISFDPNLRPTLWASETEMRDVLNDLAVRTDWVLPGLLEGALLTGRTEPEEIAAYYHERGVKLVAMKAGAAGAYLSSRDGEFISMPAFPVTVVDTVGAGDGFAAGIISGMLDGLSPRQCLERATAIGAIAVTCRGDMDGMPNRETLDAFLRQHRSGVEAR